MGKEMTPEQTRKAQIFELRKQVEGLKQERQQRHKIAEEKAEIKRLMSEVHPSKIHRLTQLAGRRPHLTPERKKKVVSALRALKKAGREFNKVRADIRAYGQRRG